MSIIGEAALSQLFQLLLGKLISPALDFVADYEQVHEQLKEWKSKLPCLQAVLNDAEEKQIKDDGVKNWLADVQDLAYDVDDVLDEFAYEALRLKLQTAQAQPRNSSKVRKFNMRIKEITSYFSPTSCKFNIKMVFKIKEITARLNNLASQKDVLELRAIVSEGGSPTGKKFRPLQPTSLIDETVEYVGREKEKVEILKLLRSFNTSGKDIGPSVISILGMGGMGKTALAQLVYNDASLKDVFDHRAWIYVSDDFDAISMTKTILKSISPEPCDDHDLNLLQVKLKEKLLGKTFLLVLDDIWNENSNDWTIFRSPFDVGTKIVVTTRLQNVSSTVATVRPFCLDKLSHGDCLSIFIQHALGARDFSKHLEFKEVGENIVRRCDGLPLAAKVMGGLLHTIMDGGPGAWEKIYEHKIWDLPEEQYGILPALLLSYHHLSPRLKQCFAYCSILPKDYEFEEEEIILLWRAEGFLQLKAESQVEDFGNQCFRDLASRSFFQKSSKDDSRYVMHDLMNDLAQLVAGEICSKMEEGKQRKISNRTRHSSYVGGSYDGVKKFEAFDQVNSLRTFLPLKLSWRYCYLTSFVLDDLLPRLNCLRVLSLKGYCITELPDIFENFKHLRFLDFSETSIKCLPHSLCTLYHLETLILRKCEQLGKLPSKIGNLMELHYLDISGNYSIKGMPLGVGKLTNLQRLSNFILGEGDGHHIRQLRNLSKLRGDFCLSGLENVKIQDARDAKLNENEGIDKLILQWSRNFDTRKKEDEEWVLYFLCPQKKLEQLIIENYGGAKFPGWIADSSLKNLSSLKLRNCENCKSLPSFGRLPMLKDLLISGFDEVEEVGAEFFGGNQPNTFASLETLRFEDMPNWKEWDPCEGEEQVSKFPCLRELYIKHCPELLGSLPTHLHSLQRLEINECRQLVVSVSGFPSLCEIKIRGCEELVDRCSEEVTSLQSVSLSDISKFSIPPAGRFTNSEYFEIGRWEGLSSLSENGLGLLGHRFITIGNCPQLVSLETGEVEETQLQLQQISGIESLIIYNCERLNRVPKVLHALPFLTEMQITYCPSLVSFAGNNLPSTLKRLLISRCENLKYLVDERESNSISNSCCLEDLEISDCSSLICLSSRGDVLNGLRLLLIHDCSTLTSLFLNGELPMKLKQLEIFKCPELECISLDFHQTTALQSIKLRKCDQIKSLPRGLDKLRDLQEIQLYGCSKLVSFEESELPNPTNLRVFSISRCENFGALPKCMYNFTSLRELTVTKCSADISFPEDDFPTNLTSLEISNASGIYRSLIEWGLDRLTSLQRLIIGGEGCSDVVSFPKEEIGMMLPASLTHITIGNFKNLRYMFSNAFQNLTSFEYLRIINCSRLRTLPEKDKLLSLERLWIKGCPLLAENCKRDQGKEWAKIVHIPFVEIGHQRIIPPKN